MKKPVSESNSENKFLFDSSWPKFRANSQNTGQSLIGTLPSTISQTKKYSIGRIVREPVVGPDEKIYVITDKDKLFIIDINGTILKEFDTPANPTCPTFTADGRFYLTSIGIIVCYDSQGKVIWDAPIDGIPTGVSVNSEKNIFFAAHSFDWAGIYGYTHEGDRLFDTALMKDWDVRSYGAGAGFSEPIIDIHDSIITAFRYFNTYTWDPEEGPEPEHLYECHCVSPKGKKLWTFKSAETYLWKPYFPIIIQNDKVLAILANQLLRFNKGDPVADWWINYFDEISVVDHTTTKNSNKVFIDYKFAGYPSYESKTDSFYCRLSGFSVALNIEASKIPPMELGGEFIISGNSEKNYLKKHKIHKIITSNLALDANGNLCAGTNDGIIIISPNFDSILSLELHSKVEYCIIGPNNSIICSDDSGNLFILR